jgi:hypothetical protein
LPCFLRDKVIERGFTICNKIPINRIGFLEFFKPFLGGPLVAFLGRQFCTYPFWKPLPIAVLTIQNGIVFAAFFL